MRAGALACLAAIAMLVVQGTAWAQTPKNESAQQNVKESQQYESLVCSNPGFRAKRIAQELRVTGAKRVIIAMQHSAKGKPKILRKCNLPLTSLRPVDLLITETAVISLPKAQATPVEIAPT